ncbi:MAG: hypothetical protein H5T96_01475 [Tissierellales bacterium]|nr:hypothetical protein [Tissierellales bacterium]
MTERLYWENPYLSYIDAYVTEKYLKDGKCYLKLNRTIFYPDQSGGQPRDVGYINNIEVQDVYEDGLDIVHVLNENIDTLDVKLSIDMERRFDHMQQHTAQHVLSKAFLNIFNWQTESFHLGSKYSTIDISTKEITEKEIEKAELLANKIVQSNFKVSSYIVTPDKLEKIPIRKKINIDENIRIVEIDGLDYSICAGTHVSSTGEIGIIKIVGFEKVRSTIRLKFIAGQRALNNYLSIYSLIENIRKNLSANENDVLKKVLEIQENNKILEKQLKELKKSIIKLKAEEILSNLKTIARLNFVIKSLDADDYNYLDDIKHYVTSCEQNIFQIYTFESNNCIQFNISSPKDLDLDLKTIFYELSKKYEIKGGGNTHNIQGNIRKDHKESFINDVISNIIKSLNAK